MLVTTLETPFVPVLRVSSPIAGGRPANPRRRALRPESSDRSRPAHCAEGVVAAKLPLQGNSWKLLCKPEAACPKLSKS
jgi:hypothetical protein